MSSRRPRAGPPRRPNDPRRAHGRSCPSCSTAALTLNVEPGTRRSRHRARSTNLEREHMRRVSDSSSARSCSTPGCQALLGAGLRARRAGPASPNRCCPMATSMPAIDTSPHECLRTHGVFAQGVLYLLDPCGRLCTRQIARARARRRRHAVRPRRADPRPDPRQQHPSPAVERAGPRARPRAALARPGRCHAVRAAAWRRRPPAVCS